MEIDALFERLEDKNPSIDKVAMAKIVAYIRKLEARILTYEDGIKKAIEVAIIALVVGASMKLVLASVPAVMIGAVIAKVTKLTILRG